MTGSVFEASKITHQGFWILLSVCFGFFFFIGFEVRKMFGWYKACPLDERLRLLLIIGWLIDWLLSQTFCCFIRATLFMDLVWLFVLFRDYWKSRILMRILIARNPNWCLYNYLSFSFIFFSSLDFLFFLRCIQTLKVLLLLVSGFSAYQSENIDQSATFCVFWWVFDCSKVNLLRLTYTLVEGFSEDLWDWNFKFFEVLGVNQRALEWQVCKIS